MAKVVGPLHSFEASGKIGPLVFARNRSGAYARAWYLPVNPKSFAQSAFRREVWAEAVKRWVNCGSAIRANWYEFAANFYAGAKSSKRSHVDAMHLFIRYHVQAIMQNQGATYNPPVFPLPNFYPNFSCYWTSSGLTLSWQPAIPSGCLIVVYQQRCLMPSNLAPHKGQKSHEFDHTFSSPQLISPPSGNGGGPGNQPPFNSGSVIQVHCFGIDAFYRKTVPQFFSVTTG
jgi:hypothetical protein